MRRAQAAALAVALALLIGDNFGGWCAGVEPAPEELEDEGDTAPFMVVVRRADGRACGAALVSLRTALSSAACVRGAGELWAVAPAAAGAARPVVRLALAAGGDGPEAAVAGDPWAGADGDLALLELAAPLPTARAILMATDPADCEPPQGCHLVRLVRPTSPKGGEVSGEGGGVRLRIVDAQLEGGEKCAALGPRWSALRARTLCVAGPELCQGDRGTGVVCGGKLCGVVSRSAGAPAPGDLCGDAHAAASVPRWRRFLHCAHTRGACGQDGDCARLCSERWLVDAPPEPAPDRAAPRTVPAPPPPRTESSGPAAPRAMPQVDALRLPAAADKDTPPPPAAERGPIVQNDADAQVESAAPRSEPAPARSEPAPAPTLPGSSPRAAFEFEPNRADFRMSAASTRVFFKAGEYGDNGADYAAPEDGAGSPAPAEPMPPARTSPLAPATAPPPAPPPTLNPAARKKQPRAVKQKTSRREQPRVVSCAARCASSCVSTLLYLLLTIIYHLL